MKQAELETAKNKLEMVIKFVEIKHREKTRITDQEYQEVLNELSKIKVK